MATDSLPRCSLLDPAAAKALENSPETLTLIRFDGMRDGGGATSPWIGAGLEWLGGPAIQAWQVATSVKRGRRGGFTTHLADGLGLLATTLPDSDNPETLARELYSELLTTARQLGLPHFLRIWQYLPRITAPWRNEDRYRAYCAGRRRALEAERHGDGSLPAACLLGDNGDEVLLYALVADRRGVQVENPRQQSAFFYPSQYGRKSPSFSRAMTIGQGASERLYISGTSSITGHASRHTGVLNQLDETIRNLEALVGHWQGSPAELARIAPMKVYLRHAGDLPAVRDALAARLPAGHPVTFLRADVCRAELNIEIEGVVEP